MMKARNEHKINVASFMHLSLATKFSFSPSNSTINLSNQLLLLIRFIDFQIVYMYVQMNESHENNRAYNVQTRRRDDI